MADDPNVTLTIRLIMQGKVSRHLITIHQHPHYPIHHSPFPFVPSLEFHSSRVFYCGKLWGVK